MSETMLILLGYKLFRDLVLAHIPPPSAAPNEREEHERLKPLVGAAHLDVMTIDRTDPLGRVPPPA